MKRFHSLKDIKQERYRLYLEKELAGYKLKYFVRNVKASYSIENIFQESIGNWVSRLIGRFIWKKTSPEKSADKKN